MATTSATKLPALVKLLCILVFQLSVITDIIKVVDIIVKNVVKITVSMQPS